MAYQLTEQDKLLARQNAMQRFQSQTQATTPQVKAPGIGSMLLGLLPGGSLLDKGIRGEKISGGDVATEVALTALPFGIGKIGKLFGAGAKAASALARTGKAADTVSDITKAAKVAGAVAPKTTSQKIAQSLMKQSTIAPISTLKTASEQNKLVNVISRLRGMKGSAASKFQKIEPEINKMTNKVDDLLSGVKTKIPASSFQTNVSKALSEIVDPAEAKRFKTEYNNIVSNVFKNKVPNQLSASDLSSLRRAVNNQLSSTYIKMKKGTQLTDKDEALVKIKNILSKNMEDMAPASVSDEVRQLNRDMSTLISGIPELKKASEEALQIFGTRIPVVSQMIPRVIQSSADIAGRTLNNPLASGLLAQAGTRVGADILGMRQPVTTTGVEPTSAGGYGTTGLTGYGMSGADILSGTSTPSTIYSREAVAQDIQNDLAATGGANMDKYITLYNFLNPEASTKMTAAEQKQATATAQSNAILNELESGLGSIGGGRGISAYLTKAGNVLSGGAVDPTLATYDALRAGITSKLARSLGEVGTLTDQDIQRALNLIPSSTDSSETAAMKMSQLRDLINAAGTTASTPASSILSQYGY